jgi:LPS-assembly protein
LRHLIEPFVQYRNVPNAEKGTAYIPAIDRTVFDTRLPTLDLGDIRFLDDLHPLNTLRIGLDQRLQTRDSRGGSRDLVALILAEDFRFARTAGQSRASGLQADLAVKPASWLQFDAYQRFDPSSFALREFNSGLTLTDGQFWTARFGTQYLHGDLEEYTTAVRVRLNERFAVTGRWRYDARNRRLYEQSYGLRQNFHNLWDVEYQIAWTKGEQRDSGFQVRVLLDVLKF